MEKTIKNMELILKEMRKGLKESNTHSVKTLADTYLTLFKNMRNEIYDNYPSAEKWGRRLQSHKVEFEIIIEQVNTKLSDSIISGYHKESRDIAIILERVNKSIRDIEYLFPAPKVDIEKDFPVDRHIQNLLDKSIETGTLVTFFDETHRGMGKTTALVKKAHELNVVLVMGLDTQAHAARDIAENMGLYTTITTVREATTLAQYRELMKENGYLIDELVDNEQLRRLGEYKLLGGFTRIVI